MLESKLGRADESNVVDVRKKYREERDKRVRTDGVNQYVNLEGDFSKFDKDHWAEGDGDRDPITVTVDAVTLGAGMASMLAAVEMQKAGLQDIIMIDKAGGVGGTWYWNRYPGAQCDTESYIYLPLLEETGYIPKEKYSFQPEILEHLQRIASHFGLDKNALFQTQIIEALWSDETTTWTIKTNRGDVITARYFILAPGRLQSVKLPGIKGLGTFKGHAVHTGRWDWGLSGSNLENLADKRVGVIGTGATGIQVIPQIAKAAKEVFVFQRTPAAPWERNNAPTPEKFEEDLEPGWQHRRMRNFTAVSSGLPAPKGEEDMVDDGWTHIGKHWWDTAVQNRDPEVADLEIMERIRSRIDTEVKDPATAAVLKPYFNHGCKRANFHDEYLATYNRPNTHLVDTHGRGVDEIVEGGVNVDGKHYPLDVLVFASGYDVGKGYLHGTGLDIIGRSGKTLANYWANGMRTFHGLLSHGFPNLFILGFTQTTFSASFAHMVLEQTKHLGHLVAEAGHRENVVEATVEGEAEYVDTVLAGTAEGTGRRAFLNACTPGWYNNEGNMSDPNAIEAGHYPDGGNALFDLLEEWRSRKEYEGVTFSRQRQDVSVN